MQNKKQETVATLKSDFRYSLKRTLLASYGKSIEKSTDTELFTILNQIYRDYKGNWYRTDIDYDLFIRTTFAEEIKRLQKAGLIKTRK